MPGIKVKLVDVLAYEPHSACPPLLVCIRPVALQLELFASPLLQARYSLEFVQASEDILAQFLRQYAQELAPAVLEFHGRAACVEAIGVQ